MCLPTAVQRMEQTWEVRCTGIHVLMHVHIIIKVWDHGRGDRGHMQATQGHTYVCNYQMCLEQMWEVRWMYIHVLIYGHILPKM